MLRQPDFKLKSDIRGLGKTSSEASEADVLFLSQFP